MRILESDRLILRHLEPSDLESLFALYQDPEMVRYIPDAPLTLAKTQKELAWFANGHPEHPELGLWATVYKETGQFIGRCGLIPWEIDGNREVEIAFMIDKKFWGQGLGTEVAQAILEYGHNKLGLTRMVCLIEHGNVASIRVAEKIGMAFEKEGQDEIGPFLLYTTDLPTNP